MVIDHVGWVFFPKATFLRFIGRLAFPIFCYLLVDAYSHIKDNKKRLKKYSLNLFLFALISEIPHDLLFYKTPFYILSQNVLLDLFLGLLFLIVFDYAKEDKALKLFYTLMFLVLSSSLFANYSFFGILLILGLYLFKKHSKNVILYTSIIAFIFTKLLVHILVDSSESAPLIEILKENYILFGSLLAIPLILNYNGQQGKNNKIIKYFFYCFYPLHLLVLLLIKKLI